MVSSWPKMVKIMIISSWFPVCQMLNWLEVHVTVENTSEGQLTITLWLQERELAITNEQITSLPAPAILCENQLFEIPNLNSALFPNLKT